MIKRIITCDINSIIDYQSVNYIRAYKDGPVGDINIYAVIIADDNKFEGL